MQLDHYLTAWELSEPALLTETFSSYIYRVQHGAIPVILKLLKPAGFEERAGAIALQHFAGQGAVHLLRSDDHAQLLEYVPGESLIPMVRQGWDQAATQIIAQVIARLHAHPVSTVAVGLPTLKDWFRSLFRKAAADEDSIFVRAAGLAAQILADPREQRVLHGDIHHDNIRYSPSRGWLAFDAKGLYGERTYDLANTLCNPIEMPDLVGNEARLFANAAILAAHSQIDLSRVLVFTYLYACLSASWSLEDGNIAAAGLPLRVASIIEPHLEGI